jgi:peptidyl-prolyl cis-trans isomerase A (cyclophilin A)
MNEGPIMKLTRHLGAALAAALLLAACGGGGADAGKPPPTVTTSSVTSVKYSETMLITLVGSNLDQTLTLSSTGCIDFARSTTGSYVSTATTAYYTCTVSGKDAVKGASITVAGGGITVATVPFTVAWPQVTMIVTSGASTTYTLVMTLYPDLTPQTVDNFLAYVKSGFYNGTAFHRNVRTTAGSTLVLQGGGYAAPVSSQELFPAPKATNAPIPLERGLSNKPYIVAMMRAGAPDSATSQFFINTADNALLLDGDGTAANPGYAGFGNVTTGTTLVDAMVAAPCNLSSANFGVNSPDCVPEPNLVVASAQQTR